MTVKYASGDFFCIKDMGGRLDLKKNAYLCPTKKE